MEIFITQRGRQITTIPYIKIPISMREEIMQFYITHGARLTRQKYNVSAQTLGHLKYHNKKTWEKIKITMENQIKKFISNGMNTLEIARQLSMDHARVNDLYSSNGIFSMTPTRGRPPGRSNTKSPTRSWRPSQNNEVNIFFERR